MSTQFYIDPDIRKAQTMPSAFYTDEKYFEASKEKIFARTWQIVAFDHNIKGPGSIFPTYILAQMLGEPLIITKNEEGELNCLSNVCTHRGKQLFELPCEGKLIRCGYHGRRFSLDGKFLSMREFEQTENFPSESDNLPHVPFGTWANFLFASAAPLMPVDELLSEMTSRIAFTNLDKLKMTDGFSYNVGAHWALYCENYLEGFHIPFVHDALNKELDYGSYNTETFRYVSLQTGHDKNGEIAAQYFFVFPNMMFNFYPWGLSVNIVIPHTSDFSVVEYYKFVSDESKLDEGAGADLHTVELEDQKVVESVQEGIRSRFYNRGRYSPTREQGCHHFHRLLAEFMT
ncbi:MAG TPA: SRPBCC family protein [Pyrinomonadaceae bacterium]|jgi:choline monooxygenase|nr:SRPBCC family protein [Pyrinomonadaceae bacterium]